MQPPLAPLDIPWTLRSRLVHFICLVNELQPVYEVLERNNLSTGILNGIVRRCSREKLFGELPRLTSDGHFISQFLVRNCGNYLSKRPSAPDGHDRFNAKLLNAAIAMEPSHVVLNRTQLSARAPRWVWDPNIYTKGIWQRANIVQDVVGRERELGKFRVFHQGQSIVSRDVPHWRRQDLHEWQHTLRNALLYRPGLLWMNAEVWAAPKGKDTGYHYDYDSHVVLFQVVGSRRFHVMEPQSGSLEWEPLKEPATRPIDYGTRWATQKSAVGERVFETKPGSTVRIPNGWPHKVVYKERSIGFRVASWTQCQALSMWLGQRLCILSTTTKDAPRMCFDDEFYREHRGYIGLERGDAVV